MLPTAAGYDRAITLFSPDGRLYQVEYAIETVRRGSLAIGIKSKDGVVLSVEERARKLQVSDLTQKIFQIDDHIGVAAAGYIPDARTQVDLARFFAQSNRLIYDEPVYVEAVAKNLADMAQQFTQYAGVRPYAVALILAGVDKNGTSLYQTDPSGTYIGYNAAAIGNGSDQVNEFLEKNYHADMSMEDASSLALESIYLVSEEKIGTRHIKMCQIDTKTKKMKRVEDNDLQNYVSKSKENVDKRASQ
ncbi:MAG TPA: archaeal proteasome endopeptidase complex subunit alpha [Nitrososphaeraceae archaeon]|nr:archaeal proteasome endopeptidase complex subunit alpha [Nitrososphaeraceae archaeon]